jgi:hypothetical protein
MSTQVKFSKDADTFTITFDGEGLIEKSDKSDWDDCKGDPMFNQHWVTELFKRQEYDVTLDGEEEVETDVGKFNVAKLDTDKRLVFGWAYVTHDKDGEVVVDKSGEFIDDYEVLEKAAYEFVITSRTGGDHHERDLTTGRARAVGTMVESMMFTPEKIEKMGLPPGLLPTGWWVGFKVTDDAAWQAVKAGERPAFSIHGTAKKEPV